MEPCGADRRDQLAAYLGNSRPSMIANVWRLKRRCLKRLHIAGWFVNGYRKYVDSHSHSRLQTVSNGDVAETGGEQIITLKSH